MKLFLIVIVSLISKAAFADEALVCITNEATSIGEKSEESLAEIGRKMHSIILMINKTVQVEVLDDQVVLFADQCISTMRMQIAQMTTAMCQLGQRADDTCLELQPLIERVARFRHWLTLLVENELDRNQGYLSAKQFFQAVDAQQLKAHLCAVADIVHGALEPQQIAGCDSKCAFSRKAIMRCTSFVLYILAPIGSVCSTIILEKANSLHVIAAKMNADCAEVADRNIDEVLT